MTVMSWLRLTVTLWLLRKAVKATGWLLLLTLAVALWPVTLVTAAGYLAAWLRGWPPARLRRAAVASLILAAVYAVAAVIRQHGARAALAPVRAWQHGWHQPAALEARGSSQRQPRLRSRPGCSWPPGYGPGGSTPCRPGSAAGWPRPRSPSTPGSGAARSAPPPCPAHDSQQKPAHQAPFQTQHKALYGPNWPRS